MLFFFSSLVVLSLFGKIQKKKKKGDLKLKYYRKKRRWKNKPRNTKGILHRKIMTPTHHSSKSIHSFFQSKKFREKKIKK